MKALLAALLLAGAGGASASQCQPAPLEHRPLFLRGTMNNWQAEEAQQLRWACDHYELVTRLDGDQQFKIADEDWSPDADFGGAAEALRLKGPALKRHFEPGVYRLRLRMTDTSPNGPALTVEACPRPAPFGDTALYLRGPITAWGTMEHYAFQYSCDAYYLNVDLRGLQHFRIADAANSKEINFGAAADGRIAQGAAGNLQHEFQGEHTLRLSFDAGNPRLEIGPRSFADPRALPVDDPVALGLAFDSRNPADKTPFGAVPEGTNVHFEIKAPAGVEQMQLVVERRLLEGNQERLDYEELARVPMRKTARGWAVDWRFGEPAVYGYYFLATIQGRHFVYGNNKDAVYWTREKGSMGLGLVEALPDARRAIRRYRQTAYARNFQVPAWARDAVYYYIFPERYRNGNRANDPRPGVDRYHDQTVELHKNWLDKPWKPGSGDGSDALFNNDFFGGDLAGIIEKLDDIKDLGANTIYMTPIWRAASNHKYDTADYTQIDPAFGTNEDFARLCAEAAKRGIRVIPDASLNHVGSDSVYFDRYGNFRSNGAFEGGKPNPASPWADWFTLDPSQAEADKQYKGWVGVPDLPEINKASKSFRAFAYGNPDSVMKQWLDRGAAGWRMDVAPWVPDDFWREWRAAIKAHKPDALTVAETWFDASKFLLGDEFDSTMNYIFRSTVLDYAAGGDARKLYANIELMREAYPPQAFYALMNLLSTHDTARSLHVLGYHDDGDAAKLALAKQRLMLAVLFQMSFPGSPAIYYGDEVGLGGGDDPYNRGTYPWPDEGGKPDLALRSQFKRLIHLRQDHAVLRHGTIAAPVHLDEHVIALLRQDGEHRALVLTNNAETERSVTLKLPAGRADWTDALSGEHFKTQGDGTLTLRVPALDGRILLWK
jgi:glycosidase